VAAPEIKMQKKGINLEGVVRKTVMLILKKLIWGLYCAFEKFGA